jgi:hypothetical protein
MTIAEGLPEHLQAAAECLETAADITLVDGLPHAAGADDLSVLWARDATQLRDELGDDQAASWIGTTVGLYLAEAAHEIKAIAALLQAEAVTASLSPLIRSVLERLGVARWILDVEVDSIERAWRAVLNALISYKYYREAIELLGASKKDKHAVASAHRQLRGSAREWFSPTVDDEFPEDSSLWKRGESGFPDYTDLAAGAMPESMPMKVRRGMYAAQCGMTHPNILVLAETIRPSAAGQVEFFHRPEDIEKLVRAAFATFLGGMKYWSRYFNTQSDFDSFALRLDALADTFDALFVGSSANA